MVGGERLEADWAPALGRVPSGIFILTVAHEGQATGMLASWVMQAGFEPPMLTVAVKRGRYVADWIAAGAPFALNLVGASDQLLIKHFGRGFEPGEAAFTGLETVRSTAGVPLLAAAMGQLECHREDQLESEDHIIFLARIVDGRLVQDERPMVHVRSSGRRY